MSGSENGEKYPGNRAKIQRYGKSDRKIWKLEKQARRPDSWKTSIPKREERDKRRRENYQGNTSRKSPELPDWKSQWWKLPPTKILACEISALSGWRDDPQTVIENGTGIRMDLVLLLAPQKLEDKGEMPLKRMGNPSRLGSLHFNLRNRRKIPNVISHVKCRKTYLSWTVLKKTVLTDGENEEINWGRGRHTFPERGDPT